RSRRANGLQRDPLRAGVGGRRRPAGRARRATRRCVRFDCVCRRQRDRAADERSVAGHRAGLEPGTALLPRAAGRGLQGVDARRAARADWLSPFVAAYRDLRTLPPSADGGGARVLGRPPGRDRSRHRRHRQVRALLRAVPHAGDAARARAPHRARPARAALAGGPPPLLRRALGHLAMAPAVPPVLFPLRHGPAGARSGVLPLRRDRRGGLDPPADAARVARAGSGGESLRALDPDRHARDGAAVRASRRALRDDPRSPRSAGVALRVGRGAPGAAAGTVGRSLQSQRPVRVRLDRALSPHAGGDGVARPAGRAAGLLEHAGAAAPARAHGRSPPSARRSRRQAPSRGSRVLLQRVPRRGSSVSAVMASLAAHTLVAIAVALAAFMALFVGLRLYAQAAATKPETTRKMFHAGSGVLTLAFPFLFHELWPVLLLTGASVLLIASVKFVPAL